MKLNTRLAFAIATAILLPLVAFPQLQNKTTIDNAETIVVDENTGAVAFASFSNQKSDGIESAIDWLQKNVLFCKPGDQLRLKENKMDKEGFTHLRLKQFYHQFPVEYGTYYIHIKDGRIHSVNGEYYPDIKVESGNELDRAVAFQKALDHVSAEQLKNENDINRTTMMNNGVIVVLPHDKNYSLAWKFDIYSERPLKRAYIYIDAYNGTVISEVNRIHIADVQGTAVTMYNGTRTIMVDSVNSNTYRLRESERGMGINTLNLQNSTNYSGAVDFTDSDNYWNNITNDDHAATDAHLGSEKTYDFFYDRFGRDSYDDAGAVINSYIHYSSGFVNAFWDGSRMTYGDGDGIDYTPLTTMDIVGHEITHAVTEYSAGLIYSGESGALNESYSDIFGIAVDFYANPGSANWLQGEGCNVSGIPFRSLSDPNQFDCPDTYLGDFWSTFGQVHTNSGVMNYWFYLLSVGGSGINDNGDAFTVTGINIDKAAAIAYRSLNVYLTPNSTYANARFYAIQSAIDLFGSCSQEVIQTTNAWHAVGVGAVYSNAVIANFDVQANYFCSLPAIVEFTNLSVNSTTFQWDFGDGTSSTDANPIHNYTIPGSYDVTLIATGTSLCNSSDTIVINNYISVTNSGGPLPAACSPATQAYCCNAGIYNVSFGTINNSTLNAVEGYSDYTCSDYATFVAGDPYLLNVTTSGSLSADVSAWIDYNNDGSFNNTDEAVFSSQYKIMNHTGYIYTPVTAALNTPLRMRIIDDASNYTITGACYNPIAGQCEDYTVYFTANTQAPVADFIASTTNAVVGNPITFNDLSVHVPSSWQWSFPGAVNTSSTMQNPVVVYNSTGTYTVSLTVANVFGQDSITKIAYITVTNSINMCEGTSILSSEGTVFDPGGSGPYSNSEYCSLLIAPPCAQTVTLSFISFSTESCCDRLRVYDGPDASGTLLLNAGGSVLPSSVTALSGEMYLVWTTDGSVTSAGFQATWSSVNNSDTIPPGADFTASDMNPPYGTVVSFSDISSNFPVAWNWQFDDGFTSTLQNPFHQYSAAGIYTVSLSVTNCYGSDSISKNIQVQQPPIAALQPDTIEMTVPCGSSDSMILSIINTGAGDLIYDTQEGNFADTAKILAFTFGADMVTEYPNTISSIMSYYPTIDVTVLNSTLPADLQAALADREILLFPEQETGGTAFYNDFSPVVLNFIVNGGTVIICGSTLTGARLDQLGLFTSVSAGNTSSGIFNVDTNDVITSGVPTTIQAVSLVNYYNFTNPDKHSLVTYTLSGTTYDVVAYRNMGSGKAIYIGSDYYTVSAPYSKIIANSVSFNGGTNWISTNGNDTVAPSTTGSCNVIFDAAGLTAGDYVSTLSVNTNDPLNTTVPVTCIMHVIGTAEIQMSVSCLNFGNVFQGSTTELPLIIFDNGCDSLHISSAFGSSGAFSIPAPVIVVPPFSSDTIMVSFNPGTLGSFNDTLYIYNNDADTFICLTGVSLAAPVIASPDSIALEISSCEPADSIPFYIYNTGGSQLEYEVVALSDSAHILSYINGSDISGEYANVIDALSDHFTGFSNSTSIATTANLLQSELMGKNVLLFVEHESLTPLPTLYADIAPAVQNFASNGGTVIICGSVSPAGTNRMYDMGLFTGAYVNYVNSTSSNMIVIDPTHYLTDGLGSVIPSQNAVMYHDFTDTGKSELVSLNGYDVLTMKPYGAGRIIYIGYDYYSYDINASTILANAVSSVIHTGQGTSNVYLTPDSGSVNAADSQLVYLHYSAAGLTSGLYNGYLLIQSNDPENPFDTIHYTLNVTDKPCVDFGFGNHSTCTYVIPFIDSTVNNPDSWLWSFGDGNTSTLQHPVHSYSQPGTYTVQLTACNGLLCDSISKIVTIYNNTGAAGPLCKPSTMNYCCGYGIRHVIFGSINNVTGDASEGYKDFTCSHSTNLLQGVTYTFGLFTSASQENAIAWIDYNNNYLFEITEIIYAGTATGYHSASVTIPSGSVTNTPLRMRIGSDNSAYSILASGCANVQNGQYEDYTVVIEADSLSPIANINFTIQSNCTGVVNFTGNITGSATSWLWDFGDGNVSIIQNPVHQYVQSGNYSVTLIASTQFGTDTATTIVPVIVFSPSMSVTGIYAVNEVLSFNSIAPSGSLYAWDFGNGSGSFLANTSYTYTIPGTYIVSLTVNSSPCSAIIYDTIVIRPVSVEEIMSAGFQLTVFPNPYHETATIEIDLGKSMEVSLIVNDVAGRMIQQLQKPVMLKAGKYSFIPALLNPGVYFITARFNNAEKIVRMVKL